MSTPLSSEEYALTLNLQSRTYVAGERVSGVVQLDFLRAQEEKIEQVRVKLRGSISTRIHKNMGRESYTYRSTVPVVRADMTLWTRGSTYPSAGTHVIDLPFWINLPKDLPASFYAGAGSRSGTISYGIEVVADRRGLFRSNRRIGQMIRVLPSASPEHVERASLLRLGVVDSWTSADQSEQIRRKLWGEYSDVNARLTYPALDSFPMGVPVPVSLVITTTTKTMDKSDTPQDAFSADPKKPMFPALPAVDDIRFYVGERVNLQARNAQATVEDQVQSLNCFQSVCAGTSARVSLKEPVWIPSSPKGDTGRWKREAQYDSSLVLACPPTVDVGLIRCAYSLCLEIPFPGIGNGVDLKIPIHVNSGVGPFNPNAPPPPTLDLPPDYFSGEYHEWDGDEKTG